MFIKNILIVLVMAVVLIAGCSKTEKDEDRAVTGAPEKAARPVEKETPPARIFYTCKFTDDTKWSNGIDTQGKNVFFIIIARNAFTPIRSGYKLKFASAGEAIVQKVYRMDRPENSMIFITVDKNLDPVGDGNPNPIYIKSFEIRACASSMENKWRNGINLKQAGVFFFALKKDEPIQIKIGDRLVFAKTGEAIVKNIVRFKSGNRDTSIIVTVDKPLDPEGDGSPNPIEVVIID
jgi:hypothetical protein